MHASEQPAVVTTPTAGHPSTNQAPCEPGPRPGPGRLVQACMQVRVAQACGKGALMAVGVPFSAQ